MNNETLEGDTNSFISRIQDLTRELNALKTTVTELLMINSSLRLSNEILEGKLKEFQKTNTEQKTKWERIKDWFKETFTCFRSNNAVVPFNEEQNPTTRPYSATSTGSSNLSPQPPSDSIKHTTTATAGRGDDNNNKTATGID